MANRHAPGAAACLLTIALAGCSETSQPLEPAFSADPAFAVGNAPLDISGEWRVQSENFIHLGPDAAPMFGFEPEGARTTIRCTAVRIATFVQDGASFHGSQSGESTCVSAGGQVVHGQGVGLTVNGQIRGRSVSFTVLDGPVECPTRAAIQVAENGEAVVMKGNHTCLEPGHPQSAWPAPPPRMGPNQTIWTAYRLP
jgi:hypothetical protein